ncbi:MAG: polysaccharide ABC transporter ATP-binding protein, partial [bacterium]
MSVVIKVENLSKIYRLGIVSSRTIVQDINKLVSKILKKETPDIKLGVINNRAVFNASNYVWALKDINFEIRQGEVIGIIGKNGAGKSTLLKILSRVTSPTSGKVKIRGRVASLLEVGTGFHQDLTGRENVYLNGSILGMTKSEIKNKFDEIVEFSGIGNYIDTPVKRFSTGMLVRLAFAVAAHLEPEILIVDEVLAVGDAEFQKKCLGKMHDVSIKEGRTVLFVSHNMGAVSNLCSSSLLLENGMLKKMGKTEDIISDYFNQSENKTAVVNFEKINSDCYFTKVQLQSTNTEFPSINIDVRYPFKVTISLFVKKHYPELGVAFTIFTKNGTKIFYSSEKISNLVKSTELSNSELNFEAEIPGLFLTPGNYFLDI